MANAAVIGALRVVMGADTATFEAAMKRSQGILGGFAKTAGLMGAAIGGAIVAAGGVVAAAVVGMVNKMDDLNDMRQRVGMTGEELTGLGFAASQSGLEMDKFAGGIVKLNRAMSEAANGTGKAKDAFKTLGVSVTNADGTLRKNSDVLRDVAGALSGMEDGADKTALAMDIFGKSGADMIPLLNEGKDGIAEMEAQARQLGVTISTETLKAADEFNDSLGVLKAAKQGLVGIITARLLPTMNALAVGLINAMKNTNFMNNAAAVLSGTLKVLVSVGAIVGATFMAIGQIVGAAAMAVVKAARGDMQGAWDSITAGARGVNNTATAMGNILRDVWSNAKPPNIDGPAERYSAAIEHTGASAKKAAGAHKSAAKEVREARDELLADATRVMQELETPYERARREWVEDTRLIQEAFAAGKITADAYAESLERLSNRYATARGDFELVKPPTNVDLIDNPLDEWAKRRDEEAAETRERFAESFGDAFANGIEAAMNGDLKGFLKATFADIAHGFLRNIGTKLGDWLAGGAGSAGGKGSGILGFFSSIASLFSKAPKFASGGSFRVGGVGGTDANLIPLRLTKGETVDIHRKGADRGGLVQVFKVNAQGAVLAEGLIGEMQSVGVQAAFGGAHMGQRNTERSMVRRQTRKLGLG